MGGLKVSKNCLHLHPKSLNPCFGGRCGGTRTTECEGLRERSLNPCFGGRCGGTGIPTHPMFSNVEVLILVLVEDVGGQNTLKFVESLTVEQVLILVLVEDVGGRSC